MAHLFISYSRSDRPVIEKLSAALEDAGHSVWWDRHISGGAAFAKKIEAQLDKADGIIVAWSSEANESDWVKDEAVFARDKGKLIPLCLTDCEAPIGFRQYQTIDFKNWKGDPSAPVVQSLFDAVAEIAGGEAATVSPAENSLLRKITTQPRFMWTVGALVFAFVAALALIFARPGGQTPDEAAVATAGLPASSDISIAVLPFTDMSENGDQGYFAAGLSEELLDVLYNIDGLGVASRTSSFIFTEQKIKELDINIEDIASRLKVNHILEGSVRKMGDDVRITAQLIDARDNKHLWSETFDRKLSDIFRIQEEIATAVVSELRQKLGLDAAAPVSVKTATDNLNAYDKYLKAHELYLARSEDRKNVVASLHLFEEVVDMDATFAKGWEGLAAVYGVASSYGILDRDYSALALVANKKALELDPDLSMPYAVIGLTYRAHYPTPWVESFDNLNKALERDPRNASAWQWLGMNYIAVGAHEDAVTAFSSCLDVDQTRRLCRRYRSIANFVLGNIDEALIDVSANAEANDFRDFDAYIPLFLKRDERIMAFAASRMVNWRAGFPHQELVSALEYPEEQPPERLDKFLDWGRKAGIDVLDNTNLLLALRAYGEIDVGTFDNDYVYLWLPQYAHYRKTPQFKQLAEGLGLVTYWREAGFPAQCRELSDTDFECG